MEVRSYPADEAATPEKLEYRQAQAPELFYGVYDESELVAFIVSTASNAALLTEESMDIHEPGGESICIHSVCVDARHRRKGIARAMVRSYVEAILADPRCAGAKRMLLMAHAPLLGLYAQSGFAFVGPSDVVHGSAQWFDMRLDLAARRRLEFFQVDAFTPVALSGNPAAVLFTHRGGDEEWMQAVAIENNLSETAFLEERLAAEEDGPGGDSAWDIRWFTPGGEVALCGHATLASAHALWDSGKVPPSSAISFHTRKAGTLFCSSAGGWIKMDFPAQPPTLPEEGTSEIRAALVAAVGVQEEDVLHLAKGPETTPDWLLEVTPSAFAALRPDSGALARIRLDRGVIITCAGGEEAKAAMGLDGQDQLAKLPRILKSSKGEVAFDFASRFFAPAIGIDEDPVTGSAHCILAPYWTAKLGKEAGTTLFALQASLRGGLLRVRYNDAAGRVDVEGQAVTVLRGQMAL